MNCRSSFVRCGWLPALMISASAAGQPANDLCENATPISLESGCVECVPMGAGMFAVYGATNSATTDGGARGCGGSGNTSRGVWFRLEGRGNRVRLSTDIESQGTEFDTQIAVYCGSCAVASCVAFNDDKSDTIAQSEVEFCARDGETYWVLVNGFNTSVGSFGLLFGEIAGSGGQPIACCDVQSCGTMCEFVIPEGATEEPGWGPGPTGPGPHPEPCVSDMGYANTMQYNDGCTLVPPAGEDRRFGAIHLGQTILGTLWAASQQRDRDWFVFEQMPPGSSFVRYEVSSEGPVEVRTFFNSATIDFYDCTTAFGIALGTLVGCGQTVERVAIMDGSARGRFGDEPGNTIGFRLVNNATDGYPCGTNNRYWMTLHDVTAVSGCPPLAVPVGADDEAAVATFNGLGGNDGFVAGEPCYDSDPDGNGPDRMWRKEGCGASPITDGEFLRLTPGVPMAGKVTAVVSSQGFTRDLDYYKFQIAERSVVSIRVDGNAPITTLITSNACDASATVFAAAATRGRCLPGSWVEAPDLVTLDAGTYIVVAHMADAFVGLGSGAIFAEVFCGDPVSSYVLSVEAEPIQSCGAICPVGAIVEMEPCVADAAAMFDSCSADNDGCSRAPFTSIEFAGVEEGAAGCGTLFSVYEPASGGSPERGERFVVDQDYWTFSAASRSTVSFSAAADGPVRVQLVRVGAGGALCDEGFAPVVAEVDAGSCAIGDEISIEVGPGTYALAVAPGSVEIGMSVSDYPCGRELRYGVWARVVPACCFGNADGVAPGRVDFGDVAHVLANFGAVDESGLGIGDADCSGLVDFKDVMAVLANFLEECP